MILGGSAMVLGGYMMFQEVISGPLMVGGGSRWFCGDSGRFYDGSVVVLRGSTVVLWWF